MLRDIIPVIPVLIVSLSACAVLLAEAFRQRGEWMPVGWLALIGVMGGLVTSAALWNRNAVGFGVLVLDNFAIFFNVLICGIGLLTILMSSGTAERDQLPLGEYYALVLFALAGMMLMASTRDLLIVFIGLEVMSLSVYVLTSLKRTSEMSAEGGFKYFILGAFSSAFFLYGIAFAYAVTGTTRLDDLGMRVAGAALEPSVLVILAMVFLLVGFAFKVSAVPFHMWTPDAYQGAPTLVTGFMSTGVKAAAFAAFIRVFLSALEPLRVDWLPILSAIAGLTMILGTVVGVAQTSVKRMLAYSSIAHAGYLLVGLVAANAAGKASILFYLVAYAVTNLGAFGVLSALCTADRPHDDLRDFAGLAYERPGLAALLTVFLLSLGGFPPTVGFVAKWYIFSAAIQEHLIALAVLGVLTSVVSVFFYLRIVVQMYMVEERAPGQRPHVPAVALTGLVLALAAVFYLGVLPGRLLSIAASSVSAIF
ncbi:MAG TPA: NADH-quinone oxidoreductase subunit N [Vicinamibacterales bacterium]|jgi:NADH-quinone oxidoreductase subunit N|nr:NADH-quinone oxidoreductase subunit N [Vicinamibacterales bacterium]